MDINTALRKSSYAYGCEALGGTDWGQFDISMAEKAVVRAWELGVRIFDTANVYGLGLSEKRLGRALGKFRKEACLVTKGGIHWTEQSSGRAQTFVDCSREALSKSLDESLQRLDVSQVSVYLIHRRDPNVTLEATLESLEIFRKQGKILQYGFSNLSVEDWRQILKLVPDKVLVAQFPFSLIDDQAAQSLLPVFQKHQVITMAYGALAQGLLTGKHSGTTKFTQDDRRHRLEQFINFDKHEPILKKLKEAADKRGLKMSQMAIRWVYSQPGIDCTLVGAKSAAQVESNLVAFQAKLTEPDYTSFRL